MPRKTPLPVDARPAIRHPAIATKKQRDAIRKRWRAVIVDDFGSVSAFRSAWKAGSLGQQAAEAVYRFLQDEKRTKDTEGQKDLKLSTVMAFAEMTGRTMGYLLSGEGPEREGELRQRTELGHAVSAALTGAIPSSLRDIGLHVDGTSALAFVFLKVKAMCEALEPLVQLGTIVDAQFLLPSQKKQLFSAIEAASRQATAEFPGLLTLEARALLHTTLNLRGKPHRNPALRRTVEHSYEIARMNAEASRRAETNESSASVTEAQKNST